MLIEFVDGYIDILPGTKLESLLGHYYNMHGCLTAWATSTQGFFIIFPVVHNMHALLQQSIRITSYITLSSLNATSL